MNLSEAIEALRFDLDSYLAGADGREHEAVMALIGAVERVRELHRGEFGNGWCAECCDRRGHLVPYPCPTIKALDGTP